MDVILRIVQFILAFNAVLILCGIPWYLLVGRHRQIRLSVEELSAIMPADLPALPPFEPSAEIKTKTRS
jgi:hypothetical protein